MASIYKRKNRFNVIYSYEDENGNKKQKWESFRTLAEATKRQKEIEYKIASGAMSVSKCTTMKELLEEYVKIYGKNSWSYSTYSANTAMINNYIEPLIGKLKLKEITPRVIEHYYQELLKTETVTPLYGKRKSEYVNPKTIRSIHKLLHSCFEQAIKWEMMEKNPCTYASRPKAEYEKREIWTAETLFKALELCEDEQLKLAINLAFSCSLRIGELLGLTWDCVDISEESIREGKASIYINKELQRVDKSILAALENKDVIQVFPCTSSRNKTRLVLKSPKTTSSIRKVFLPKTVAEMLIETRQKQWETMDALGEEYHNYKLVIAGPLGNPVEANRINDAFKYLIEDNDLPKVVFHSLRHSSITYKLKLNGGDVKAVQGDSGHAQSKMVTDLYSHILDDDRRQNAQLFEDAFYSGKNLTPEAPQLEEPKLEELQLEELQPEELQPEKPQEVLRPEKPQTEVPDISMLLKLLQNPEMATLLTTLAKGLQA